VIPTPPLPPLSEEEGRALLSIAREAVRAAAAGAPLPDPRPAADRLQRQQGAFVTLHQGRRLRGCIGVVVPRESLAATVVRCAAGAACEDPRFAPVTPDEVNTLDVEVSVLETPRQVRDPEEIEVGRHGLLVTQGSRRGLLLPQVAVERGWDRTTFLRETCRKADLDPDAWRDGARIEVFGAQIIPAPGADQP
jgi:AmmeMemoRadiSam system protein A